MAASPPEGWQLVRAPDARSRAASVSSHGGNGGGGNGRHPPPPSAHRSAYDEEKIVFLEDLLHGDDASEAEYDGNGGGSGGGGSRKDRWLLDGPHGGSGGRHAVRRFPQWAVGAAAVLALVLTVYAVGSRVCTSDGSGLHCAPLRWAAAAVGRGNKQPDAGGELARPAGSECNDVVGIDRVALMFLSLGAIPQDALWAAWLEGASGIVPLQPLQARVCNLTDVREACSLQRDASSRDRQFLFSFYSHTRPNYTGHAADSVLHHRIVPGLLETAWGSPENSAAERAMLREALKEPRNQRFLMLSDSGVPLYPPTAMWQHLIGISKSRIDACTQGSPWEWNDGLSEGNYATRAVWRKSSQFWALTQPHAELVAWEEPLFSAFRKHCVSTWGSVPGKWYQCYTSESYFATALALHGRDNETDCLGHMIAADWSRKGAHPKTYAPEDVTIDLIRHSRQDNAAGAQDITRICDDDAAIQLAARGFVAVDDAAAAVMACEGGGYQWDAALLGPLCPLMGRKFDAATAKTVLQLLSREDDGLDILPRPVRAALGNITGATEVQP